MISTGIDIVNVDRFRKLPFDKNKEFYKNILNDDEISYCLQFKDPYPNFAARFALKEAIIKSLKKPIPFKEIHISHGKNNQPEVVCDSEKDLEFQVSISHESDFAIAIAILIE